MQERLTTAIVATFKRGVGMPRRKDDVARSTLLRRLFDWPVSRPGDVAGRCGHELRVGTAGMDRSAGGGIHFRRAFPPPHSAVFHTAPSEVALWPNPQVPLPRCP